MKDIYIAAFLNEFPQVIFEQSKEQSVPHGHAGAVHWLAGHIRVPFSWCKADW